MNLPATVRIDIWSDFVCPWCWIGKHRLARALAAAGRRRRRSAGTFLLGRMPAPSRCRCARPMRRNSAAPAAETDAGPDPATARAEGLPMDFDRGQVRVSTRDAHQCLAWWRGRKDVDADAAPLPGVRTKRPRGPANRADALSEALFRPFRARPQPCRSADADRRRGRWRHGCRQRAALLAGDDGLAAIGDSRRQARRLGIDSVPFSSSMAAWRSAAHSRRCCSRRRLPSWPMPTTAEGGSALTRRRHWPRSAAAVRVRGAGAGLPCPDAAALGAQLPGMRGGSQSS